MSINTYDVSVVLPTYNERKNILLILHRLKKIAKSHGLSIQGIVVDDNSTDGTIESIKGEKFQDVLLIQRIKERGLATAIRDGIRASKGPVIVVMDTDLNHDPHLIPELLQKLSEASIVIGSRFIKNGGMDNRLRYLSSKLYNKFFLAQVLGSGVSDNLSGYFAMYRKDLIPFVTNDIFYGYGDYFLRLIYSLKQANFAFIEVPCYYKNRTYGQSKSNFFHMLLSYSIEAITYVFKNKK